MVKGKLEVLELAGNRRVWRIHIEGATIQANEPCRGDQAARDEAFTFASRLRIAITEEGKDNGRG